MARSPGLCVLLLAIAVAAPLPAQAAPRRPALRALEARAREDSLDSRVLYELAAGYLAAKRYDAADSVLRLSVALDPQLAVAWLALGVVRERDQRFWRELRRQGGELAVAAERRHRAAWTRKAFLVDPFVDVSVMGVGRYRRNGSVFYDALNAFAEGDYAGAYRRAGLVIDHLRGRASSRDSIPPFLLLVHALAAARSSHYREAIADIQILIRLDRASEAAFMQAVPLNTNEYRYVLAALYQRLRQHTRAIRLYEEVLAHDIGNYMAHVQLARIYEAEQAWFDAVRERRLAADVNPEDHSLRYDLGATLAAAGRWQEAEQPLLDAAAMEPRQQAARRLLDIVRRRLGSPTP